MEPSGALAMAPLAPPLALDGHEKSKATLDPQGTPIGDSKENEEATLDVMTEKVDTLEKEADALEEEVYVLQRGATLQEKVRDLQGKKGVLDTNLWEKEDALQDGATQKKVEDLQGKQGVLDTNLLEKEDALQDGATQEKVRDLQGKQGVLDTNLWEKEDGLQDGATQEEVENPQGKSGVLDTNLQDSKDALQYGATQEKVEDLQGKWGDRANMDPVPHSGDPEGIEAILEMRDAMLKEHNALIEDCNALRKKADALQKLSDTQQKKINDLLKELSALLKKPDAVQKLLNALRKKLDALRKEFNALQRGATREKAKDLQRKQGVLTTLNPPVSLSGDQEEEATVTLDALRENMDTLQKQLSALRKKLDARLKDLNALLKDLKDLLKELNPLRKELDARRKELNGLLKELSALRKDFNALQKELEALQVGATREKAKDLQGKQRVQATLDPPMPPSGDQEDEEEVTLNALQENADALQKAVDALQGCGGATRKKVKALKEEWEIQMDELYDIMLEKLSALEKKAEALWNAWFQNTLRNLFLEEQGLPQENVNSLRYYLLMFLQNMSIVKKVDELHDALQEERSVPCHGLGDALWEKMKELDFALWDINLYTMDELQDLVDAFSNALREDPQKEVGVLLEKLEAMQDVLRLVPLKKLSALREITGVLHDAMLDFPRDAPAQEKQDALWDALQDVPLKEMCDQWRKVKTMWGFPLKMFAVWEKVYNLKIFLQAGSQNRVCTLQENVEALKDALRDALREEMGAHQDKLAALRAAVHDFPLNELGALEDKLNALGKRLWNISKEKLLPLKETVDASQMVLDSLRSLSQGELPELPEEEVDALQRTPAEEEITEADKLDFLPAWKTPDTGPGLLSVTQQGDFTKMKPEINLNVEQEISLTSSQPDDYGRSNGQKGQENEELISEDVLEAPPKASA